MNLLLDTHVALWAVTGHRRLSSRARALISDPENTIAVSAASVWEIAIKYPLRRRAATAIPLSPRQAVDAFDRAGYAVLPVMASHAVAVEDLPPIHSDPFDRLIIAQALDEPLRLLTHDNVVLRYSDTIVKV